MSFIFVFLMMYGEYVHHIHFGLGWWILAWVVGFFGEPFDVRIRYQKEGD